MHEVETTECRRKNLIPGGKAESVGGGVGTVPARFIMANCGPSPLDRSCLSSSAGFGILPDATGVDGSDWISPWRYRTSPVDCATLVADKIGCRLGHVAAVSRET